MNLLFLTSLRASLEEASRARTQPSPVLLPVFVALRGVARAYRALHTVWRIFRQSCQELGCRADAHGGYATFVTTRNHHHYSRLITTQSRELARSRKCDPLSRTHGAIFWPRTAQQVVAEASRNPARVANIVWFFAVYAGFKYLVDNDIWA